MKRWLALLILLTAAVATGCAVPAAEAMAADTEYSPLEIGAMVLGAQDGAPEMRPLTWGEEAFFSYLSAYYSLEPEILEDGAIYYAGGASAREIAVLELGDGVDAAPVEAALLDYIERRAGDFYGYLPQEVLLLEQAEVIVSGNYVALMVCDNPGQARTAFASCFGEPAGVRQAAASGAAAIQAGLPAQSPPTYSAAAVLEAWRTGDQSELTLKDSEILQACRRVIDKVITDDMSEYEKELVIHDWIIRWADYDTEVRNQSADARPNPDNDNPYGLLMGRKAICNGYTSTFQLLMDMLEIECQTVYGTARGTREHAWNMVRLDGEWYCVDITWNDPSGLSHYDQVIQHKYFNVTSETMRETSHQWDEAAVPEAYGTRYGWHGAANS